VQNNPTLTERIVMEKFVWDTSAILTIKMKAEQQKIIEGYLNSEVISPSYRADKSSEKTVCTDVVRH